MKGLAGTLLSVSSILTAAHVAILICLAIASEGKANATGAAATMTATIIESFMLEER